MGERAVRMSVLLFIGCLGLLIRAHEMTTDLAGLAGIALGALRPRARAAAARASGGVRRRRWASGVAFLGDGFLPLAMLVALIVAAAARRRPRGARARYAVDRRRSRSLRRAAARALAARCSHAPPAGARAVARRRDVSRWSDPFDATAWALYFAQDPALVRVARVAARGVGAVARAPHARRRARDLQLPLVAFVAFFVVISVFGEAREVNALPLLLPLAILGVAELESAAARRGERARLVRHDDLLPARRAALDRLGRGDHRQARVRRGVAAARRCPGFTYRFSFLAFALAALLTLDLARGGGAVAALHAPRARELDRRASRWCGCW